MMKYFLLLFLPAWFAAAQYTPKSAYLQSPEKAIGYVDSCGKLWKKAYEPTYGGFYTNIDQMGNLKSSWGTNKNMLNQSRDAYGFTRAFQMTGDTSYLRYAQYALSFMTRTAWDTAHGGWYNSISKYGVPTSPGDAKTAYYQHYALVGLVAYYEAVRDTSTWNWITKSYAYNTDHLWDTAPATFGYFDKVNADGTSPSGKSFNATVDAVTTHLLHLYLMTGEQQYRTRLLDVAENMVNRLAASAPSQMIGFVEKYTTAWQPDNSETMTIMGHVLKTAWCLARMFELENDSLYLSTAEELVQIVLTKGYDHDFGGPYKDYNRLTGEMLMWGQTDTAKAWWQMEQAITSGLYLYHITNDPQYLQMADETLDFFMKYFVDHVYGDIFSDRTRYGNQIWGLEKGSDGKAAYHSIETGYYSYLYGKLYYKSEPVTLYYYFKAQGYDRMLAMKPIETADGALTISGVKQDGTTYTNYNGTALMLTIPAGTGGIFAVTYEATVPPEFYASVGYAEGWNLISVPLLTTDNRVSTLFPTARSSAFSYQGLSSYQANETVSTGMGYWLKFDSASTTSLAGKRLSADTVHLSQGWNLIGSMSSPLPVSSISSAPPGILTSRFFTYEDRYVMRDSLLPGFGYWVFSQQAGDLFLTTDSTVASARIRIGLAENEPPPPPVEQQTALVHPTEFSLNQNYPNPFNPSTVIRYSLPVRSTVQLRIYSMIGEQLATLVDGIQEAGTWSQLYTAQGLSSGVYFYRLTALSCEEPHRSYTEVQKMVFVK